MGPNPTLEATSKRRRWATLAVLGVTLLLISLDNTVLNVALPTIVRSLGASKSERHKVDVEQRSLTSPDLSWCDVSESSLEKHSL